MRTNTYDIRSGIRCAVEPNNADPTPKNQLETLELTKWLRKSPYRILLNRSKIDRDKTRENKVTPNQV